MGFEEGERKTEMSLCEGRTKLERREEDEPSRTVGDLDGEDGDESVDGVSTWWRDRDLVVDSLCEDEGRRKSQRCSKTRKRQMVVERTGRVLQKSRHVTNVRRVGVAEGGERTRRR